MRDALGHLQFKPEKFIELPAKDDYGDAAGESCDDRVRKKFQKPTHLQSANNDEHDPSHHGGEGEAAVAILSDDGKKDRDERAGRSGDLETRPAQQGDRQARDNSGP